MPQLPLIQELGESIFSDVLSILADLDGGLWDRMYEKMAAKDLIPNTTYGRYTLIFAILISCGLIKRQVSTGSVLSRLVGEVTKEMGQEVVKRIFENRVVRERITSITLVEITPTTLVAPKRSIIVRQKQESWLQQAVKWLKE